MQNYKYYISIIFNELQVINEKIANLIYFISYDIADLFPALN